MEHNLDTPNSGIEDTISAGQGDADLIKDLIAPETSTADPDNVVSKEAAEAAEKLATEAAAKAAAEGGEGDEEEDGKEAKKGPDALASFLIGGEEDEDEDEGQGEDQEKGSGKEEPGEEGNANENDGNIAFDALANELADLGVFNRGEGEETELDVKTPEEFLARFKTEKEAAANQMVSDFIGQFGQEHQDAFQAIYVKGVNPETYFTSQAKIEHFKEMDLTKEANQESVVRAMLKEQSFEPEDINNEVDKLKNYGDLEETSKRYHKVLVKKESASLEAKVAETQEENNRKAAVKQEYTSNVSNILTEKLKEKSFDGIPINPKTATELQDFLLVDKWKTESGELLTDFDKEILELKRPENHASKVKLALLLKLLEKDPTLSTIQKRGVSKKSSTLFKEVARQKTTDKRSVDNNKQSAESWWQK